MAIGLALIFISTLDSVGFTLPNATWIEQAKLTADDAAIFDVFGGSVAVSGDTAVIGARGDESAYVFVRSSSGWSQQAKLTADDAEADDEFGYSVALDGDTAVIGAYLDDDNGVDDRGSVYVFVYDGNSWIQQAKLTADDGAEGDRFGFKVALNGETVVIGAPQDDDSFSNSGSAYLFVRNDGIWSQQAKLVANDAAELDEFGNSVAVDGDTAVVGARKDDADFSNNGAAYLFVRNSGSWSQQAKLTANDATHFDEFGSSVAVDNDTAVIGATGDDDNGDQSGSAYVFVREGSSWSQQAKLTADDAASFDQFGNSVAVDGDTAVVGAWGDTITGFGNGSAYLFVREGNIWSQQTKLVASDTFTADNFGQEVGLDGKTAIFGAPGNDDADTNSGSAYVFAIPAEISINDVSLPEANSGITNFQFTITRTDNIDALSIDFSANDDSAMIADLDYLATSGTITFAAGGELAKQITVQVVGDTKFEANENFFVTLSNVIGNGIITDSQGMGTIENDDEAIEEFIIFLPMATNNLAAKPDLTTYRK